MLPVKTIQAFDAHLAARGLRLEAVVVGGTALVLLGVTSRQTRDCDVLDPEHPTAVLQAAREFAASQREGGLDLGDEWLNNGARDLVRLLPPTWKGEVVPLFEGAALRLRTLGRLDLLRTKLFALCDRATDLPGCLALEPTAAELARLEPWLRQQDLNADWPDHVRATLVDLGRRLGHGV